LLRASLDELVRQSRPPERVVICAPCADDVGPAADDGKIEVVLGPRGLTRQRNAILDRVRDCDVVVFFDDDFLPTPSYLEVVERVFIACPDVVMTTGLVIADGIIGPGISLEEARSWLAVFSSASSVCAGRDGNNLKAPSTNQPRLQLIPIENVSRKNWSPLKDSLLT